MKTYLTPDDIQKILGAATNQRDWLIVHLLWTTGMRVNELTSLKKESLDTNSGTLIIKHEKSKNTRFRQIPLRPDVAQVMAAFVAPLKPQEVVFSVTYQHVDYVIRELAEKVGLTGRCLLNPNTNRKHYVSSHSFRSALATYWLKKRGDIEGQKTLQEMLGHASFATTARYFKLGLGEVRKVYEEIWEK